MSDYATFMQERYEHDEQCRAIGDHILRSLHGLGDFRPSYARIAVESADGMYHVTNMTVEDVVRQAVSLYRPAVRAGK